MSLGGRAAAKGTVRGRRNQPLLEDSDPGIPLEQVPYFSGDLKRLGVVAAIMVVLLIGGAQLIPLVIK
jgi:hypothetical protein